MSLGIGSVVWQFDDSRRVYDKEKKHSGPIYREHFVKFTITGETKRSWTCGDTRYAPILKFDKRTLLPKADYRGIRYPIITSETELDNLCFINDNKHKIAEAVKDCKNADVLRYIQRLLIADQNPSETENSSESTLLFVGGKLVKEG